jgi:hypothetical protein
MIIRSLGGAVRAVGVVLTATDATVLARLTCREIGGALELHLQRSAAMAAHLDTTAAHGYRESLPTGGRSSTWRRMLLRQPGGPLGQRLEKVPDAAPNRRPQADR